LFYVLILFAVALLYGAATFPGPPVRVALGTGAMAFAFLAFAFRELTIENDGDALSARFGPLPIARMRIPYREITAVEAGTTSFVDGLGIHYVPGRGWTWNIWGSSCVVVHEGHRTIRLGTDDAERLVAFIRTKIVGRGSEG